ncbi:putative quinol monooxygenase [Beijerinckia sp. L45]|uniref:putative quinol monooxygenase n=1 Tax=Beijerinckia sp. L45 TaxID=1641855 RepID=UPI00131C5D51|nr:antibiotic biosynthesis monooxygenase family protein [Beijerinckia sp. L45]
MTDGVTIIVELNVKPEIAETFFSGVQALLEVTATHKGFRNIIAVRHKEDSNRMIFVESWDSEEDFNTYTNWRIERGDMSIIMDAVTVPPKVDVWPTSVAAARRDASIANGVDALSA